MDISRNQHQYSNHHRDDRGRGLFLTSFQRQLLQNNLQKNVPQLYRQRIEIMLLADEGKTQTQICKALGCSQGTARHWTFMARSGMAHNWQTSPIGRPKVVSEQYLQRLQELVSQSPREFGYSFGRWTGQWLSKHLAKEFGIELCDRRINQLLKDMGLSTRPKTSSAGYDTGGNDTNTSLKIRDLEPDSAPDLPTFNPIKIS
ncbi:MAG: helix-turn-helix domain-containing protein [Calothrix sp. MO_167.B42]|nr:helix-turn-helix domain-containing protein [Calothrix sp. MO_167.B42]